MHNPLMLSSGEVARDVRVSSIGVHHSHADGFLIDRPQGSGDFLFLHFESPSLVCDQRGTREVAPGSCLLYAPGQRQWYRGASDNFCNSWMHFQVARFEGFPTGETFVPTRADFIVPLLSEIERENARREKDSDMMARLLAHRLLILVARAHPQTEPLSPQNRNTSEALAAIRAEILARPQAPWTVEKMARRVHLSESRFSVLYRAQFGTSPGDDVIENRLAKARYLLLGQGVSVEFVARECGFSSPFYFSRLFKAKVGVAPRDYYREKLMARRDSPLEPF